MVVLYLMEPAVHTWRIVLAYHGANFAGWQRQRAQRTVEQCVLEAIEKIARGPIGMRAAGRTDAGVHARGQTLSARFSSTVPEDKLIRALNAHLPTDISVMDARFDEDDFDAKRDSIGKRYAYYVSCGEHKDPFVVDRAWHMRGPLDVVEMRASARHLVGEHDFESFRSVHCDAAHARRYLWKVDVSLCDIGVLLEVRGNAFCRNMVRVIAGTLVDVGRGRYSADDVREMLAAKSRPRAGQTAPAHGLFLEEVYYRDTVFRAEIPEGARFPGYPA